MATAKATTLQQQLDGAFARLKRQLAGMDAYLDRSDAPGEWTTREVLSHLIDKRGDDPVTVLKGFATHDLPVIEIDPGATFMDEERKRWTLADFVKALDVQRRAVGSYLDALSDADLERKARVPLFKAFMGTEEVTVGVYVGALFGYHWNDHAAQLAKIRKAVGLPDAP